MSELVYLEVEDGIGTIRLDRPPMNALCAQIGRELGALLTASVRTVDRAAHVPTADAHRIVVVLPETGPEGARTFTGKLVDQLRDWLTKHGATGAGELTSQTVPFPEDEPGLAALRASFAVIDEAQHPVTH